MSHNANKWRDGNRIDLIENGDEFFPRVFEAISRARHEILLETFILFEDAIGLTLHQKLIEASLRGVLVEVMVDGYGSPKFSAEFLDALADAGVNFRVFDPHRDPLGLRLHFFRRMHRKLLVVDGVLAFVGGINYSADHMSDFGPDAKQDYAVEIEGPVVTDIRDFIATSMNIKSSNGRSSAYPTSHHGHSEVMFAVRDNEANTTTIERHYRSAIRSARNEIVVANAYFFPGYGFLHDLCNAARRGVHVSLIVQGEPDMSIALSAARTLYRHLIAHGVRIHEYCRRPFHGKIALVDDDWATIGSSNLDPLSLSLNLEANVFIRDRIFNRRLHERMRLLKEHHCRLVSAQDLPRHRFWHLPAPLLYHVLRRFPAWAGLLPDRASDMVLLSSRTGSED